MSAGAKVALADARAAAERLRRMLLPACERIEIAGSIRRCVAKVGDIELVAVPRFGERAALTMFETRKEVVDVLAELLADLRHGGELVARDVEIHRADGTVERSRRIGSRYQALTFEGVPVDLFIVRPPAEWGVVFTIRTGPADWSARLVTDCQRTLKRVENGQLLSFGRPIPCPEETDFLAAIGQPWVEPSQRSAARVKLRRPVAA